MDFRGIVILISSVTGVRPDEGSDIRDRPLSERSPDERSDIRD
jgi:hypothetical protein